LLHLELIGENGSIEVSTGRASTACAPDYGTREVIKGNMTKKTSTPADSEFQLSYSVAKAFEPANDWLERGAAELTTSLESLERMQESTTAALEPMKALCEHMQKLPNVFAPLRAFEEQLGALAESFEPVKALHEEIARIVEDSGAPFIQLAKSLEVVNVSRQRIARLATTLEAAAEIQAEFNKLAQAFDRTSPAKLTTSQKAA
jgi:hypothetical protein